MENVDNSGSPDDFEETRIPDPQRSFISEETYKDIIGGNMLMKAHSEIKNIENDCLDFMETRPLLEGLLKIKAIVETTLNEMRDFGVSTSLSEGGNHDSGDFKH